MIKVKVYSLDNCGQCKQTIDWLTTRRIKHAVVKIDDDYEAFDEVVKMGYRKAPVIVVDETHWAGFNEDKLKGIFGG